MARIAPNCYLAAISQISQPSRSSRLPIGIFSVSIVLLEQNLDSRYTVAWENQLNCHLFRRMHERLNGPYDFGTGHLAVPESPPYAAESTERWDLHEL
jgi:hypothetical protein